jgi:hypothetical protein
MSKQAENDPRAREEPTEDAEWDSVMSELGEMNAKLGKLQRDIDQAGQAEQRCERDEAW